jgi:hypothetical protein
MGIRIGGARLAALAMAAVAAGCGSSTSDPRTAGALQAVSSASGVRTLWENLGNMAQAQQALSRIGNFGGFLALLATPSRPPSAAGYLEQAESFPGCVSGTTNGTNGSATFNNCTSGSATLNGSASKNGDTYTANLTLTFSAGVGGATLSGTVGYMGTLTVTPTLVSGSLTVNINLSYQGTSYALNVTATFDDVALCANGLPTGGVLHATGQGSVAAGSYSGSATATFGPGCGQVAVTPGS